VTQARYYTDAIDSLACDRSVRALNFFHLMDGPTSTAGRAALNAST
jgi:hypothetical protein